MFTTSLDKVHSSFSTFTLPLLLFQLLLNLYTFLQVPLNCPRFLPYSKLLFSLHHKTHNRTSDTMPARVSDSIKSHTTNNNFLDLHSMKELPDSYAWTSFADSNLIDTGVNGPESVPVIDLDDPNAQQQIGLACKSWGVFQVTNHGIHKKLLDSMEAAGKSLFALPVQQKLKAARSPNGATGYGPARISSFFQKRMWSEGFTIFGSPLEHARQLWPNDYRKFCDIIEEYQKEMNLLARKLMQHILGSLNISYQDIKWDATTKGADLFKDASGAIQLNSYPTCPDPNRAMGLAAHTDSTLFTILYQSNTSGLQVFRDQAGWVTVPPLEGGLVINIGDLMHILTNGQYPSVYHRAVVNRVRHRLSIAYLHGPPSGAQIQPLSKLIDATHPPLYRPVTWNEYLGIKAKHFLKALPLVRINDRSNNNFQINGLKSNNEPENINIDSESKVLAAVA